MINISKNERITLNLEFGVPEAEWLKEFIQNSPDANESPTHEKYRARLFRCLQSALEPPPREVVLLRAESLLREDLHG